jgi:hypothetical protein
MAVQNDDRRFAMEKDVIASRSVTPKFDLKLSLPLSPDKVSFSSPIPSRDYQYGIFQIISTSQSHSPDDFFRIVLLYYDTAKSALLSTQSLSHSRLQVDVRASHSSLDGRSSPSIRKSSQAFR